MLVLVGASASGKSEIVKSLQQKFNMEKFITCTTREPRLGEVNDIDYHFFSEEEFQAHIEQGDFIEYVTYNHHSYGTLKKEVNPNKVVILEPSGFKNFLASGVKLYSVYLEIPEQIRFERMINRGDGVAEANKRIVADRLVFNKNLKELVNLTIDTTKMSPDESADIIYQNYRNEFK